MVARRRIGRENSVCWLRRKRSENELAVLGNGITSPSGAAAPSSTNNNNTSNMISPSPLEAMIVPDVDMVNARIESMWDHALMEPQEALNAVNKKIETNSISESFFSVPSSDPSASIGTESAPWAWDNAYLQRPDPIPSSLVHLAEFSAHRSNTRRLALDFQSAAEARAAAISPHAAASDIVCGIEFEEHGWLFATAGVSKQVRVYSLASFLNKDQSNPNRSSSRGRGGRRRGEEDEQSSQTGAPLQVHRLASKLSSLCWNPDQPGVVTVGDYDGVVVQLDLESGHLVAEKDQHLGRRVWSVSHSHLRPHLAASGSEDGSVAFWAGQGLDQIAARVRPGGKAAITSVQLSPFDENAVAIACADAHAYLYDLRMLTAPLVTLQGHARPVSYVKYLNRTTIVTASIDATLAAWDLSSVPVATVGAGGGYISNTTVINTPSRVFRGHANHKNFVGLAVSPEDHLVACGSENSEVVAYSMAWQQPMVSYKFDKNNNASAGFTHSRGDNSTNGGGGSGSCSTFCSAVAWQPQGAAPGCGPLLAAATSDGGVKILGLRQHKEE
jgi:E3 ubiquitin-protein ligase RFWD2